MAPPFFLDPSIVHSVVGVGDLATSGNPKAVISTYALGSCVGVVAYEPIRQIGGILHLMLPDSALSPTKAAAQPAMFADTGLRTFFRRLADLGADPARMVFYLAGGASVIAGEDPFRIGERNREATLTLLRSRSFRVIGSDLGGTVNRTLHLTVGGGHLTLKTSRHQSQIELG